MSPIARVFAAALAVCAVSCTRQGGLPTVGSEEYQKVCTAFYLGLAALQSGEDVNARKGLTEATKLAPGEPTGWLNLGLLQFRQQDFDGALESVATAQRLTPDNSRIEALIGVVQSRRGKVTEAISHLDRAVQLDGKNLKAAYALAQETERRNSDTSDARSQQLLEKILAVQPNNLAVLLDDVRLSAKREDGKRLRQAVKTLEAESSTWPAAAREQLASLESQASGASIRGAAMEAQFLKNVLVRAPAYRQSLDEVRTPATSAGEPFLHFLRLPSPRSTPDDPDAALRFVAKPMAGGAEATWVGTITLDGDSGPVCAWSDGKMLHLDGSPSLVLPAGRMTRNGLVAADLNYDFKTDLVFASLGGLKFYEQKDGRQFADVSASTKLPAAILQGNYTGAWAFDYDLDGDLDLVVGVRDREPVVLRNNGDGTYLPVKPFAGVTGLTEFASADVDGDGDPDVAMIDGEGRLHVFSNERLGDYRERPLPVTAPAVAITAADVNGDNLADFVILNRDGSIFRLSDAGAGKAWTTAGLGRTDAVENPSLLLADLDNNGALDLIAGHSIFLGDGKTFTKLAAQEMGTCLAAADLNGDGVVDLIGFSASGPTIWTTKSSKAYHWQIVHPRAARTTGDQRMNSFGFGGEMEVRAGLLTQKQIIRDPQLHFGMGSHHSGSEFVRIAWPNGLIQTEFGLKADQTLLAEQRLKGSCPYLFVWDGTQMTFVKDVAPMSGALGAHDPDGKPSEIRQTREWFKIPGKMLLPKQGSYDLRVTDEYWETYYLDQYNLRVADHPDGTELFVDERVAVPPAPMRWYVTKPPQPFAAARDEGDRDVGALLREVDGVYLDTFHKGPYRGVASEHYVTLTLPDDAPRSGSLLLIADGWLHPWDDSTLVALNQGSLTKPKELSLEVEEGAGKWHCVAPNLGVPAGRNKTMVVDLTGLLKTQRLARIRIRTNLEIYWDRLAWAVGLPNIPVHMREAEMQGAELRHRGYSVVEQTNSSSPEVPLYQRLAATGERWHSLEGFYTRYGDVKALLAEKDGRYVIASSGDELEMHFKGLPAAAAGQIRDFIFAGDGWMKEGDFSFSASKTVLPLPYAGMKVYRGLAGELERDEGYRRHPADWRWFHTRYVDDELYGQAKQ